jgi:hypothetical protein
MASWRRWHRRSTGTVSDPAAHHTVGFAYTNRWTVDRSIPASADPVTMSVGPELYQQVQDAADARGASVAVWLWHAMRHVSAEDFPASWPVGETALRSHESGYDHRKFGLRVDEVISRKLEALTQTLVRSAAAIIRQLIAQGRPEDFPQCWQLAVQEHRASLARLDGRGTREEARA